ncbi:MAG: hydroxyethylthiazole kinase [Desulfuromonadaceae bacterium]|nr:hydroxyethylthiazole kinase [Desulfuromonadaceae bacterium]
MNLTIQSTGTDLLHIRASAPLVHNITNFVVMNNTANALLALGASPVMAHAREEVEEMTRMAAALVINIGTLSQTWVESMELALATAKSNNIPIVFDPVGAGATTFRTQTCLHLLHHTNPSVIRGNASEIMALDGAQGKTKGVDSSAPEMEAKDAANRLAHRYNCVVCVSGAIDLITDGNNHAQVFNGDPMMPKVTGLGCTASALVGAFCGVNTHYFNATTHAMAVMGICGEIAAQQAKGPGTLQLHLIDSLYNLNYNHIANYAKVKCSTKNSC